MNGLISNDLRSRFSRKGGNMFERMFASQSAWIFRWAVKGNVFGASNMTKGEL
jgi:hypothetical protein